MGHAPSIPSITDWHSLAPSPQARCPVGVSSEALSRGGMTSRENNGVPLFVFFTNSGVRGRLSAGGPASAPEERGSLGTCPRTVLVQA